MTAKPYSFEVPGTGRGEDGPSHRTTQSSAPTLAITMEDGFNALTAYDLFMNARKLYGNVNFLGKRPIAANGVAGEYQWLTFAQTGQHIDKFGSGFLQLGLGKSCGDPVLDNKWLLGIYSKNCCEWVIAQKACYAYGGIPIPMYDSYAPKDLSYTCNMTQLETVVVGAAQWNFACESKKEAASLKTLISIGPLSDEMRSKASAAGLNAFSFEEVQSKATEILPHTAPLSSDVMSFCFTSGTTGDSKGAMLTHENMMSDAASAIHVLDLLPTKLVHGEERHLSYLPLPHIFEQINQVIVMLYGGQIGFFQGDPLKIVEDLTCLQPTIFASVPRLLNRIHGKLLAGVAEQGGIKKVLFEKALAAKADGLKEGYYTHALWDRLVFNKVKAKVGLQHVKFMITGSAPISDEVMTFLRAVFGIPVLEGYGQTECTGACTMTEPRDFSVGTVGGPLSVNDVKLVDVRDMGYTSKDRIHGKAGAQMPCLGRGEICFRGRNNFKGYYKMPEKTAEALDADGWLHSGDIGIWTVDGKIKIVDRKKNIFKLSQGEYVAAEKIEIINNQSKMIMQSFVYGDSLQDCLVSIVVADPDFTPIWAKENKVEGSIEEICKNQKFIDAVMAEIGRLGKANSLSGFEMVKRVHIEPNQWTPDDMLTPTFKLKRNPCQDKYQAQIDDMYAKIKAAKSKL